MPKPAAHELINQDSGDTEKYTPPYIIEAARQVMGGIDLDPASSTAANVTVRATTIFTVADNGLSKRWFGRAWMNHPFHRGEKACVSPCRKVTCVKRGHCITEDIPPNADWINKLVQEYQCGNVEQALCICYASTSEDWFAPLHNYPQCYLFGRTNYYLPDGTEQKGVTKGSVVTYLGGNVFEFAKAFAPYGSVKIPVCRGKR